MIQITTVRPSLPMTTRSVLLSLAGVASLALASPARGQSLATYGALEAAGLGESSALIGTSLSFSGLGISPVLSVTAQTYRFRTSPPGTFATGTAISPLLGLQYNSGRSLVMGGVGYSFVDTNVPAGATGTGLVTGSEDGVFVLGQFDHWGSGNQDVQLIASYALEPMYLWSRARAARRLYASPIFVGGEVVAQGSPEHDVTTTAGTTLRAASFWTYNIGPTVQYRFTESFRVLGAAGVRLGTNNFPTTGYGKLEFLLLTPNLF